MEINQNLCVWRLVDNFDNWQSSCNTATTIPCETDDPRESGFVCCPFCKKEIL